MQSNAVYAGRSFVIRMKTMHVEQMGILYLEITYFVVIVGNQGMISRDQHDKISRIETGS
jgi:hypothetical protein